MRITVIGGINLDVLAKPNVEMKLRDSNPGHVTIRAGGVGRNIACQLAKAKHQVTLMTVLGSDASADMLRALCEKDHINLDYALRSASPTSTYVCMHEFSGDMLCAINDMRAMDELTPEKMRPRLSALDDSQMTVLDANLLPETLLFCAGLSKAPVFLDPVSTFKASRAREVLPYLTAIKPNLMEARELTGEDQPEAAARKLMDAGVKKVFISMGAEGVYYADDMGCGLSPAIPLPVHVPLTGAGDALCAGLISGILQKLTARECARLGNETAHEHLLGAAE